MRYNTIRYDRFANEVLVTTDVISAQVFLAVVGRIAAVVSDSDLLLQTQQRGLSVCLSVNLLVTFVSPAKTVETIEMPFGELTHVGPRKYVLHGVEVELIHCPLRQVIRRRCGRLSKNPLTDCY